MTPDGFEPGRWATAAIGLAVVFSLLRLWLRRRSAASGTRGPRWRFALLLILQPTIGGLLHLALFPPAGVIRTGTLVVLTDARVRPPELAAGDLLVALPEAGVVEGATGVPDLATALRRFPDAATVRVLGPGLPARDHAAVSARVAFEPPPLPRGLVDVAFPEPVAPGGLFVIGGQVGSLPAGVVELLDPAGVVVDRAPVTAGQRFELRSGARAPGLALFSVRLRGLAGGVVEQIAAPVETRAQPQPRVLVLAGAPEPETKFMRRWAQDSGIELSVQIEVGGGVQLGDAPVPLTAAALSRFDLLVIDDRRWETLSQGARATIAASVEAGLGLLLRPTGPLSAAVRGDWAALGLRLEDGGGASPLRLTPRATPAEVEADATGGAEAEPGPELARRNVDHEGPDAVSFLRDEDGVALASWRARGRGRIGIWTVGDSYALVLTGQPELYGELWSDLFSALARPGVESRPRIHGLPRAGDRVVVCGLTGRGRVLGPGAEQPELVVDPASALHACAAFWPEQPGWRVIRDGEGRETPVYVHPNGAAPSLISAANRHATLALVKDGSKPKTARPSRRAPGSPWPWFFLLLPTLAGLWWLERTRVNFKGAGRR